MKKSTAIEILRRYTDYSIVTVGRPDIPDAVVMGKGQPFFDGVNLVYLWSLKREEIPFEGPASLEHPVRDYFSLESFARYLEKEKEGQEFSPWSQKGYLGGYITCMIGLLPPDLAQVMHLLSSSVIRWYIKWTQEDDAGDQEALGQGRLYADMGDWSPTRIEFDPDTLRLDWDCKASVAFLNGAVDEGFRISMACRSVPANEILAAAEAERILLDAASQMPGGDRRAGILPTRHPEEVRHEDLF